MVSSSLKRLKDNKHILFVLKHASPKLRKAILKNASNDLIRVINEIAYNVLNGNPKIKKQDRDRLKKYKSQLRALSKPSRSIALQRKVLVQSGSGLLPLLLSTILSSIIGRYLANNG